MESFDPAVLAPVLFLLVFPVFWCGIVWFLAQVGGWARLGQHYGTHQTPRGTPFRWQSGGVGWVNYRNVLHVDVALDGLFLAMPWLFRVGHPPLFIPWTAVSDAHEQNLLWLRFVRFSVGSPALARMRLPAKVFEAVEAARAKVIAK